jgi:hypothetical protein
LTPFQPDFDLSTSNVKFILCYLEYAETVHSNSVKSLGPTKYVSHNFGSVVLPLASPRNYGYSQPLERNRRETITSLLALNQSEHLVVLQFT